MGGGKNKYDDITWRIRNGGKVTAQEIIDLINYDHAEMFDLMIANNPANVNETLKYRIGISSMPFAPDAAKIHSQVQVMIAKKDTTDLQMIMDNFRFNPGAKNFSTNPQLVQMLQLEFPQWFAPISHGQFFEIGGVHCVYYGVGPNGQPIYNCNGALMDTKGHNFGTP